MMRMEFPWTRDWSSAFVKHLITTVTLLSVLQVTQQVAHRDSPYYVAAVVEYSPYRGRRFTSDDILKVNLGKYEELTEQASNKGADIIVFPEYGLVSMAVVRGNRTLLQQYSSIVPMPKENANPCMDQPFQSSGAIHRMSCAARKHSMYLAVNLPEKLPCTADPCPEVGFYVYNTNVVFDRQGTVIARYRKYHLIGEPGVSSPPTPDISIFSSDFGVKFGLCTHYDLLYQFPVRSLIDQGVKDLIFPAAWLSERPFRGATQYQAAFSRGLNMNILAAGYNSPLKSYGGSGIHAGNHGMRAALVPPKPGTTLIVAKVPKRNVHQREAFIEPICDARSYVLETGCVRMDANFEFVMSTSDNLQGYNTVLLESTEYRGNSAFLAKTMSLCSKELCCSFEISMTTTLTTPGPGSENRHYGYRYRLGVYSGVTTFGGLATAGIETCAVFACANDTLESCNVELDPSKTVNINTVFSYISISGVFTGEIQLPSTLMDNEMPFPIRSFEFNKTPLQNHQTKVTMKTLHSNITLLETWGVFGRMFRRDGLPLDPIPSKQVN